MSKLGRMSLAVVVVVVAASVGVFAGDAISKLHVIIAIRSDVFAANEQKIDDEAKRFTPYGADGFIDTRVIANTSVEWKVYVDWLSHWRDRMPENMDKTKLQAIRDKFPASKFRIIITNSWENAFAEYGLEIKPDNVVTNP